ncbi:MAG: hypothetical protein NVV59_05700 [Chitinophagaceae bacterium]|nr:hypothetical protein [Chitinophagaceae bacterium]
MNIFMLYLDPGSGSYLAQIVAAAALGIVFFFRTIKLYILTFFSFIKRGFKKEKKEETKTSE